MTEKASISPFIVKRDDIQALHNVKINDEVYNLGILKDFRSHPKLAKHIPNEGRLAISWVHLANKECLQNHMHPIDSMVIICKGSAYLTGDVTSFLEEGDIVFIPAGNIHGFIGALNAGFWGLSVQFENAGLYEDPSAPQTQFINDSARESD